MKQIIYGFKAWLIMPFAWNQWTDIKTFGFGYSHYLLQGRKNTISNAKQFRVVTFKGLFPLTCDTPNVDIEQIKAL